MIVPFQGMAPRIGKRVFVAPTAVLVGDIEVGDDVSIWFNCVLRGDVNWMHIGARTNIQDMSCLHVTNDKHPLWIGEEVSVAHNVMLHGCRVGNRSLIGMSTTIMDGAVIGEGCLVAAGSLVREGFEAPPYTLVAGWPATVKKDLGREQRELAGSIWQRYVRYKEAYFRDGWQVAASAPAAFPEVGFADGHPFP